MSPEIKELALQTYKDAIEMRRKGRIFLGDITEENHLAAREQYAEKLLIELTPEEVLENAKAMKYLYDLGEKLHGGC